MRSIAGRAEEGRGSRHGRVFSGIGSHFAHHADTGAVVELVGSLNVGLGEGVYLLAPFLRGFDGPCRHDDALVGLVALSVGSLGLHADDAAVLDNEFGTFRVELEVDAGLFQLRLDYGRPCRRVGVKHVQSGDGLARLLGGADDVHAVLHQPIHGVARLGAMEFGDAPVVADVLYEIGSEHSFQGRLGVA